MYKVFVSNFYRNGGYSYALVMQSSRLSDCVKKLREIRNTVNGSDDKHAFDLFSNLTSKDVKEVSAIAKKALVVSSYDGGSNVFLESEYMIMWRKG